MNDEFNSKIDLKEFIPDRIQSGLKGHYYDLHFVDIDDEYVLFFKSDVTNQVGTFPEKKIYAAFMNKTVNRSSNTFEVLGLLQGEMSKTYNKTIIFCNCEANINREVMDWFDTELGIKYNQWHWYIKLNINQPEDENYRKNVEEKAINFWMKETKIEPSMKYPTTVSYISKTKNKELGTNDYGTLIIEYKSQIISEVFKNFVKKMTYEKILYCSNDEIRAFMRGIIAAESCVEIHRRDMRYRVLITANEKQERDIYQKCLEKLSVESKQYENYKDLVISRRHNNFRLLDLDLMSLNPTKFRKFTELISCYYPEESKIDMIKEESILYAMITS